ncbi:MAG TPA: 2-amino-3,7-dideoxy-D-threo-hept-6-ulosonate synthase [Micromonospora sp.]
MPSSPHRVKAVRLERLSRYGDGRHLFVPLDHSVSTGPVTHADRFDDLVDAVISAGADAVIVHKGRARYVSPRHFRQANLIVHLSGSTAHAPDANAKVLVSRVEEAIRLGADAVSVHINIGSDTEASQLADLGAVADACDRWGMPLLAMMYPRGPRVRNPRDPQLLAHVVNIAADLGADLVKTVMAETVAEMADVVATSPVPILVAGGDGEGDLDEFVASALRAGCQGVAIGRRIFRHPDPAAAVRDIARLLHDPAHVEVTHAPALAG